MGKKLKRATKLYHKKRLGESLDKNHRRKPKKKSNNAKVEKPSKGDHAVPAKAPAPKKMETEESLDDFLAGFEDEFGGSFEVPAPSDDEIMDSQEGSSDEGSDVEMAAAEGEEDDSGDEALPEELLEHKKALQSEVSKHKKDLERLRKSQPEFFKYLEENDTELLAFDDDSSEEDSSEEEDEADAESEQEEEAAPQAPAKSKQRAVTTALVAAWEKGLKEKSRRAFTSLVTAFAEACQIGGDEETTQTQRYVVSSAKAFNKLMRLCLTQVVPFLNDKLPVAEGKSGKGPMLPTTSKSWSKFKVQIKIFLKTLLHLTGQMQDPDMLSSVLRACGSSVPYFACFPKLCRVLLKGLLQLWSSADEYVRLVAFAVIRKMAIVCPYPFIEQCLKGVYMTFVRNCKFTNQTTLPLITFMQSCVVELFQLDPAASYKHAFGYIRQLAISLRNAITLKKKDSYQQVYNWQFIHCIRVWARVLASTENENLKQLVYPLVEVTLGTAKLINTPRFFPLRFHCLHALLELGTATQTYIPLAPLIFDPLGSSEMKKKPKPDTSRPLQFEFLLKIPKQAMSTRHFQDAVLDQVFHLGLAYFSSHAYSISFPEMTYTATLRLRACLKVVKVSKLRKSLKNLLAKIEENRNFIKQRRAGVTFSPKDVASVNAWERRLEQDRKSPLVRYYQAWLEAEDQQAAMLEDHDQREMEEGDDDDDEGDEAPELVPMATDAQASDSNEGSDDEESDGDDDVVNELVLSDLED